MSEVKTYKPTHDMEPAGTFDSMPVYVLLDDYRKLEVENNAQRHISEMNQKEAIRWHKYSDKLEAELREVKLQMATIEDILAEGVSGTTLRRIHYVMEKRG